MTDSTDVTLTGRTGFQVDAADKYLADIVSRSTATTIVFDVPAAAAIARLDHVLATEPELQGPFERRSSAKGARIALQSVRRALVKKAYTNSRGDVSRGEF